MNDIVFGESGALTEDFRATKWWFSRFGRDCPAARGSRAKTGEGSDFQAASGTRLRVRSGLFFDGQSAATVIMTTMLSAMCRYMETLPWEALYTHSRWLYILETENLGNLAIAEVLFSN